MIPFQTFIRHLSPQNSTVKCLLNHADPSQHDWGTKEDCDLGKPAYIQTDYEFDPLLEWEALNNSFKTNESSQEPGKDVHRDIHAQHDTETSTPCVYTIQNVSNENSISVFPNVIYPVADIKNMNSNTLHVDYSFPSSFHQGAMYVTQQYYMIPPSSMAQNAMHPLPTFQNYQPFCPSFTSTSEYVHVGQHLLSANNPTTVSTFSYYKDLPYFHIMTTKSP